MKTKTKQLTVIIALLLLCTATLSCMGGCTKKDSNRFDTDLFCCMYNEDKTGVIILELTKKGQEQEILVIPEEINGLPVVQLGGTTMGYPYQTQHYVESDNLKKLYICSTSFLHAERSFSNLTEVIIMNENPFYTLAVESDMFSLKSYSGEITFFTTEEIYNNNVEKLSIRPKECFSVIGIANLTFIEIADEKETVVWIDNISEGSVYYCPYSDRDWYTDRECTTLWDKEYKLPEDREVLNLYSKTN